MNSPKLEPSLNRYFLQFGNLNASFCSNTNGCHCHHTLAQRCSRIQRKPCRHQLPPPTHFARTGNLNFAHGECFIGTTGSKITTRCNKNKRTKIKEVSTAFRCLVFRTALTNAHRSMRAIWYHYDWESLYIIPSLTHYRVISRGGGDHIKETITSYNKGSARSRFSMLWLL